MADFWNSSWKERVAPQPQPKAEGNIGGYGRSDFFKRLDGTGADARTTAEWAPYLMQENLGGMYNRQLDSAYKFAPYQDFFRQKGINALDPGHRNAMIVDYGNELQRASGSHAQALKNILRSRGILGADAAAEIDARNQAVEGTNQYASQQNSIANDLMQAIQGLDLTNPQSILNLIPVLLQLDQPIQQRTARNDAEHAQRAGGFLGALGNIVGNVLPMFTGGFGGGGGRNAPAAASYTPSYMSNSPVAGFGQGYSFNNTGGLWGGGSKINVNYP